MCELCAGLRAGRDCGFDLARPLRAYAASVAYEIPGDATTAENIGVGEVRTESLGLAGDEDWFRLALAAGQTVTIELTGAGAAPVADPHLWLYDAAGGLAAWNDDGGPGLGSLIEFTAPDAGTWFVAADSYGGQYAGDYRLAVAPVLPTTDPIPGDASTPETIAVGGTRAARLDYFGDTDWFRLSLGANQAVLLQIGGAGADPLGDPVLRVYDRAGRLVREYDDGPGFSTGHRFVAGTDGVFFVEVAGYAGTQIGGYVLTVAETEPPRLVDSILGMNRLDATDPVLVYLAVAGDSLVFEGASYAATGFNAFETGQLWSILAGIEALIDIDFQATADRAAADLEWGAGDLGASLLGFFTLPNAAGAGGAGMLNDAFLGWSDAPGGGLDAGGIMYGTALHEIGHALGLAHTHDTGNGSVAMRGVEASTDLGDFALNQTVFTAMSYNNGWLSNPDGQPGTYDYGYAAGFGAIDIAALQEMYGVGGATNAGDTVYLLPDANGAGIGFRAIRDAGGADAIAHAGAAGAVLDLRPATLDYEDGGGGFVSHVAGVFGGYTIAAGAVIETATGGAGGDLLVGNDAANTLSGGGGGDRLDGGAGADLLDGGPGDDDVTGGGGGDIFRFLAGDGHDRILDFEAGGDVIDLLGTGARFDDLAISDGAAGAVVAYPAPDASTTARIELVGVAAGTLSAGDFLTAPPAAPIAGTEGPDALTGTAFDDEMLGLGGADTLAGGGGADRLSGGDGDDRLSGGDWPAALAMPADESVTLL